MFATDKITFSYLDREIRSVIRSPVELNLKVETLTERLLTEMSLEEITSLEHIAQSHTEEQFDLVNALTSQVIGSIIREVKGTKPELNKLEEVIGLIELDQFDKALSLLDEITDPRFEAETWKVYSAIANGYRLSGENDKAERLEAKLNGKTGAAFESLSEKVVCDAGKDLVHSGMEALRSTVPGARYTLPLDNQMDQALQGLHNMSLTSVGRQHDASLEEDEISSLKEKLAAAEEKLEIERENYKRALLTRDRDVFMPALSKKQAAMQEVINLKRALHDKGISQVDEGDPAAQINETVRQGFLNLMGAVKDSGLGKNDDDNEPDCKIS